MTLRFEKGEIAILARQPNNPNAVGISAGDELEIVRVGPCPAGSTASGPLAPGCDGRGISRAADYEARCAKGWHWFVDDWALRKRRPPIPDEVRELFDVEPVDEGQPA